VKVVDVSTKLLLEVTLTLSAAAYRDRDGEALDE
jgi:hypothetical protein